MISAVAFACVSSDGVEVSGIEFTPELKASLGLSGLGSMIRKPLDDDTIGMNAPEREPVKQRLQRVHTTASCVKLPPLSLKRNQSLGGITDILINFDCLGVCFYELDAPGDAAIPADNVVNSNAVAVVASGTDCDEEPANGDAAFSGHTPFCIIKKPQDLLRYSRTFGRDRVLNIVSRYAIKAVMLVEPPDGRRESRICLYTNPDACDETEKAFQNLSLMLGL